MITPALTPGEWADDPRAVECEWRTGGLRYVVAAEIMEDGARGVSLCYPYGSSIAGTWIPPEKVPAVAALCLHGQPFGFTWEDVDRLRSAAKTFGYEEGIWCFSISDRIAALLPPREP